MANITTDQISPTELVIFGITGDLAKRYLLPSIYYLGLNKLLPKHFRILGVTRRGDNVEQIVANIRQSVINRGEQPQEAVLSELAGHFEIVKMDLLAKDAYISLKNRLDQIENEEKVCMNRLFYLAIPEQAYEPVIKQLGENKLNESCQHGSGSSRLLIEKPFGYDLRSAEELIDLLHSYYAEDQIYRIDHYLAKETAQNVLTFRFQNPIFTRIWDDKSISRIIITAAEKIDIEGRVAFYEQTGALRDFVQSHLLQLLALTTMNRPITDDSEHIHLEKLELLKSVKPIAANEVFDKSVRAQYDGYKEEVNNPDSISETYVALRLDIDNSRWQNTPVILRTGKAMTARCTEIVLFFKDKSEEESENILTIRIQPDEGILLQLLAKKPGFDRQVAPVLMDFNYSRSFGDTNGHPDAYERVMIDAFRGDRTLFATSDEVLASWQIIENVAHEWGKTDSNMYSYKKGTWGPKEADKLIEATGGKWPENYLSD